MRRPIGRALLELFGELKQQVVVLLRRNCQGALPVARYKVNTLLREVLLQATEIHHLEHRAPDALAVAVEVCRYWTLAGRREQFEHGVPDLERCPRGNRLRVSRAFEHRRSRHRGQAVDGRLEIAHRNADAIQAVQAEGMVVAPVRARMEGA